MKSKKEILEYYQKGYRFFRNVDFDYKEENYINSDFQDAIFENCYFGVDFTNSKFINSKFNECNLKSTDFINCDFTNAQILNCTVETTNFANSVISNLIFENNTCYGTEVILNPNTLIVEVLSPYLVKELYKNIPEFDLISNHFDDNQAYSVYGDLSLKLFEKITELNEPNKMIINAFNFFNYLGDRNEKEIDNLLIIGIYEGLYSNKKCNDLARNLLKGRNKEVYEYWMVNGNIQAEY